MLAPDHQPGPVPVFKDCKTCTRPVLYRNDYDFLVHSNQWARYDYAGVYVYCDECLPRWVTAYAVTRHYGGPEEGGWWFNWFTPVETIRSIDPEVTKEIMEHKWQGIKEGDIYSVLGGVDLAVYREENPRQYESKIRPHYE
jgi:hypothetical protein